MQVYVEAQIYSWTDRFSDIQDDAKYYIGC